MVFKSLFLIMCLLPAMFVSFELFSEGIKRCSAGRFASSLRYQCAIYFFISQKNPNSFFHQLLFRESLSKGFPVDGSKECKASHVEIG